VKTGRPFLFAGLTADKGVADFTFGGAPGVNEYTVIGTIIDIPGFLGGMAAGEYPADFDFPQLRNKGGIFENSENVCYTHFFHSAKKAGLTPVHDWITDGAFGVSCPKIRGPLFRLFRRREMTPHGVKVSK
jgi:hypothetical protein